MSRLTRRELFAATAATTPLMAPRLAAQRRPSQREWEVPNVVLIVAEGLGSWMCGCYGNEEFQTPNIDALARMGSRFSNAYCYAPVPAPSRATLLTGLLPSQHGVRDAAPAPDALARQPMISDLLNKDGWSCGYVGNWDLGGDTPGHGFDFAHTGAAEPADSLTAAANGFLDKAGAEKFFLTVNYKLPAMAGDGLPAQFLERYAETSFETIGYYPKADNADDQAVMLEDIPASLRKLGAAISLLDSQVGALLDKLRERELWSKTLIVFTSTNGYLAGRHGLWSDGRASQPVNLYDEVMRVPLIGVWPGEIPVEGNRPELVSHYDLVPTLLVISKVGSATESLAGRSTFAVATGGLGRDEEPWPGYVYGAYGDAEMVRDGRYKIVLREQGLDPGELYDLRTDPREHRNQYGNAGFRVVRERLSERIAEWRERTSS